MCVAPGKKYRNSEFFAIFYTFGKSLSHRRIFRSNLLFSPIVEHSRIDPDHASLLLCSIPEPSKSLRHNLYLLVPGKGGGTVSSYALQVSLNALKIWMGTFTVTSLMRNFLKPMVT